MNSSHPPEKNHAKEMGEDADEALIRVLSSFLRVIRPVPWGYTAAGSADCDAAAFSSRRAASSSS